ncbi:hypothetical protein [Spongiimicrobium salis]|uniref:hypothetical protein n=1 Tax=Spongiimicrobium salis TaxID=1667022 RepID=UPI00374D9E16
MEKDEFENLFASLHGTFDTEEPEQGHQARFLEKLEASTKVVTLQQKKRSWWKPLSIAAAVVLLVSIGFTAYTAEVPTNEQVAEISPEVSKTEFYFANLIEDQIQKLEMESTPETKHIIDDAMLQLKKLEKDYDMLEQDLLNGGSSKLILSAMITNFQIRIDLLQDVLQQIESIKALDLNSEMSQNTI